MQASCTDEIVEVSPTTLERNDGIVYPSSEGYVSPVTQTRSSDVGDWELLVNSYLTNNTPVKVPWHNTGVNSSLPIETRMDMKKADGWKMIAGKYTAHSGNYNTPAFFLLHNVLTGELKYWYYVESQDTKNNNGYWQLTFRPRDGNQQRQFSFLREYAIPLGSNYTNSTGVALEDGYKTTNHTFNESKGFGPGWNLMTIELAYNPAFQRSQLVIDAFCDNHTSFDISGTFTNTTSSAVVNIPKITQLTNNFITSTVKYIGDEAFTSLKNKTENGNTSSRGVIGAALVGSLIKLGGDLLVTGLTASTSKTSSVQTTINEKVKLGGTAVTPTTAPIIPVSIDEFTKSIVGDIGGWNLAADPVVTVDAGMHYTGNSTSGMYRAHEYQLRNGAPEPGISYRVEYSPEFRAKAIRYWSEAILLDTRKQIKSNIPNFNYGNAISRESGSMAIYNQQDKSWGTGTDKVYKAKFNHKFWVIGYNDSRPFPHSNPPMLLYANEIQTTPDVDDINTQLLHTYLVKIRNYAVYQNSEAQMDTVISTKTFVPKIVWGR